jgi:phenylpropionate dioxygenase-like ring-hydroxylating dioxygenase large terminal subunit
MTVEYGSREEESVLELERAAIFRRTWQLIGTTERLTEPGDFITADIAGVPVVVVRDAEAATLRGFVNICRHRGHAVASGCGNASSLQCRYHGWTYGLDGSLRGVPRGDLEPPAWRIDNSLFPLLPVRTGTWGPFLFVNLEPEGPTFADELVSLVAQTARTGMDLSAVLVRDEVVWDFECNWKIYVANTSESYHVNTVHPDFALTHHTEPGKYICEMADQYSYHRNPPRDDGADLRPWDMYVVWPNLWLSGTPGGLFAVRTLVPTGPETSRIISWLCADPRLEDDDLSAELEAYRTIVGKDDREVCESTQRSLSAGLPSGPLLAESEKGVIDFRRRVDEALAFWDSRPQEVEPATPARQRSGGQE